MTAILSDQTLDALSGDLEATAQANILKALNGSVPIFLSFAANQLGLSRLPQQIQQSVGLIPNKVDAALRAAVDKLASKLKGVIGAVRRVVCSMGRWHRSGSSATRP